MNQVNLVLALNLINLFFSHYAGDVVYNINGFLDKNKDPLFQDFKRLLFNSSNSVISAMWPEGAQHITEVRSRFTKTYLITD